MHCIVLLGPPGAGKGTQGRKLCDKLGWVHFSTGDLIRSEIAAKSDFGVSVVSYQREGLLVPDALLMSRVSAFFSNLNAEGVVSDGFPRTVAQAVSLDEILLESGCASTIIHLTTPLEVIMERALSRRVCSSCGEIFNLKINPPQISGQCDFCGGSLAVRQDDTASVISVRYDVYEKEITGLLDYYESRVLTLDGSVLPDAVFAKLEATCGVV